MSLDLITSKNNDTDIDKNIKYGSRKIQKEVEVKTYSQKLDQGRCIVFECKQIGVHQLWSYKKFASLSHRDKWSIAKKQKLLLQNV